MRCPSSPCNFLPCTYFVNGVANPFRMTGGCCSSHQVPRQRQGNVSQSELRGSIVCSMRWWPNSVSAGVAKGGLELNGVIGGRQCLYPHAAEGSPHGDEHGCLWTVLVAKLDTG